MSYPILYSATETNFNHNGIGILGNCASCEVTEEANGAFELAMQYPMDGVHFEYIADRAIIKAKADQFREPQLFRVYAITKPMSGIVTVLAEHISYDLAGIPVSPFSATSILTAFDGLKGNAVVDCPFNFWTDKETVANFNVSTPASIRSRLGGVAGSILDVYGGEYEFNNYDVKLYSNRGENRGVSIRYGKNLTDIRQEQNCSSVSTGVYPYWVDINGENLVELPEKIISAPGTYNFVKIKTLDLSSYWETAPTVEQLRTKTESYVEQNKIGIPSVSLTVSFAQLDQTDEYKHLNLLERVSLFDTVNVEFPALGVSATAKAVKMVYDVLADRVKSVTLGSVRANIADTIANQQYEIKQTATKNDFKQAQEIATAWLTNGKGYAYFRKDDLGNVKDILFMDTQDIETAVDVMRVGQSGIGFSHNGINGPYESAWTIDGRFLASFIKGGVIENEAYVFLEPGIEETKTIREHILQTSIIPEDKIHLYDFNGDGKITVADYTMAKSAYLGKTSLSEWSGAVRTKATIYIDVSNPQKSVRIVGTNMWGRNIEVYFGVNGTNIGKQVGGFSVLGDLDVNGEISFSVNSENNPTLSIKDDKKILSWKDNGDGTYALIGI